MNSSAKTSRNSRSATSTPGFISCALDSIRLPLLFDPGERWSYGVSTDWAGRLVEAASGQKLGEYFAENIFGPIGMKDTAFPLAPRHARTSGQDPCARRSPAACRSISKCRSNRSSRWGGGGLYGTMGDYLKFVRMVLNRGQANGQQILKAETLDLMTQQPPRRTRRAAGAQRQPPVHQRHADAAGQSAEVEPGLDDQQQSPAHRTPCRQPDVGGPGELVLLDRS